MGLGDSRRLRLLGGLLCSLPQTNRRRRQDERAGNEKRDRRLPHGICSSFSSSVVAAKDYPKRARRGYSCPIGLPGGAGGLGGRERRTSGFSRNSIKSPSARRRCASVARS